MGVLRAVVVMAIVAAATVLTGCAATTNPGGPIASASSAPIHVNWQVFYERRVDAVAARTTSSACGYAFHATEVANSVRVTVASAPVEPGHGSCIAPIFTRLVRLSHPVGTRSVTAVPAGGTASTFDIGPRLHPAFADASQLPMTANAESTPTGWQWELGFTRPASPTKALYIIVSRPLSNGQGGAASGTRTYRSCGANLCWTTAGISYTIEPLGNDGSIPRAEAINIANDLVVG